VRVPNSTAAGATIRTGGATAKVNLNTAGAGRVNTGGAPGGGIARVAPNAVGGTAVNAGVASAPGGVVSNAEGAAVNAGENVGKKRLRPPQAENAQQPAGTQGEDAQVRNRYICVSIRRGCVYLFFLQGRRERTLRCEIVISVYQ
jgi:hypothetical protein